VATPITGKFVYGRPATVEVIRQAAEWHGVRADVTGKPTA